MRLSYFPYDFWVCCCEAVNAAVCMGTFRCISAVLLAVYSTACPGAACCVRPGCLVCPWAAARPRAVRAASFARRVVSKPGQAPPPPTGTAARPSSPSGALHTSGAGSLFGSTARRLEAQPGPAGHATTSNRAVRSSNPCPTATHGDRSEGIIPSRPTCPKPMTPLSMLPHTGL